MSKLLILFLFLINITNAYSYSYFNFDKKKVKVSNHSYYNYVKPQIRNLVNDFYSVLKKINPLQENIISLRKLTYKFEKKWQNYSPDCTEIACKDNFTQIKRLAQKINKKIQVLEEGMTKLFNKKKNIDSSIILTGHSATISDNWHNILNCLENPTLAKEKRLISSKLKKVLLNFDIMIAGSLDDDIQKNFYFLWSNFIKKLEHEVIQKNNLKFLIGRLEELNIAWNSFSMKVPRWKEFLLNNPKNQLKTMGKRWNSILKIVLAR